MNDDLHVECAIASCSGTGDASAPGAFRVAQRSRVVVVADAIGPRGRATGAAHRATNAVIDALPCMRAGGLDPSTELHKALEAANAAVHIEDAQDGLALPPDAVCIGIVMVCRSKLVIASLGNVRCYRARAGHVSLLTGSHSAVQPDVTLRRARVGDRYVLCSAGLWTQVRDEDLSSAVARTRNADDACQALRSHVRSSDIGYTVVALQLTGGSAA